MAQFPTRIRVYHLLVLIAITAALTGVFNSPNHLIITGIKHPQFAKLVLIGWGFLYSACLAIAITCVAFGIAWMRQGYPLFSQPGHWLLGEIAGMALFGILIQIAFHLMRRVSFDVDTKVSQPIAINLMEALVCFVINVFIGLHLRRERQWSRVFYSKALASILQGFGEIFVIALLVRTIAVEQREQRLEESLRQVSNRDALHWCGVFVQFAISVLLVLLTGVFVGLRIFS